MAVKPFRPFHRIEFRRESGNPNDPDSEVTEAVVGRSFAERTDKRSRETGSQGNHYFRTSTLFRVAARVVATLEGGDEMLATFGHNPLGSDPLGAPADAGKVVMGNAPQLDWIVFDRARRKRYRITGLTQDSPLRIYTLFTEEVR